MPDHAQAGPQAALQVALLPVLRDNYLFVLHDGRQAAVVDPAVAEPAIAWLKQRDLELVAVLQTHHHSDHIGGTPALLQEWPRAEVVAALADRERIPFQTRGVAGGDRFTLLGQPVEVLAVPGHTRAHLAFHLPLQGELFCGDTLFAAGCGRLFEGSPEQMHHSLGLLAALPETTRVWCAHEYTASNLRWAAAQRPGDGAIAERLAAVLLARAQDRPTIPSSIGEERRTNLFMRAADGQELAALRRSKNDWSD
jgi:hydroxyacylglutathione hydrolase